MIKRFITLTMLLLFANFAQAQSDPYENFWKQVETLESEGLTKSALEAVEQISKLAIAKDNTTQQIKSLLYKSKYVLILEEDAQLKIVNDFKSQIESSTSPTKNILENLLAHLYWQYFQQNRYQFYNRTPTESKVDATDFRTWDLQTLFNEIDCHFQNSLKGASHLQQLALKSYNALLHTEKDSKLYRPTLFDFLSQNALKFYQTDENSITQPAYKFTIDHPDFLSDARSFSNLKITSQDTTSLQLKTLKIYQNLIAFHLQDQTPEALIDIDIQRLLFVYGKATFPDRESVLLNTLQHAAQTYKEHEASTLYTYEIATKHYEHGQEFDASTNTETRWQLKTAMAIADTAIQAFPKSKGAEKCSILKQDILKPQLTITAENTIPVQSNSMALVNYANLNRLAFRIFKLSEAQLQNFNSIYRKEERIRFIKTLEAITSWESELRDEGDYQAHTTEVVLPKLDNGHYLIVAAPDFSNEAFFAYKTLQVTNMALLSKTDKNEVLFQVIDRTTGTPIVGAQATVSYKEDSKYDSAPKSFQTNNQGEFSIISPKNRFVNLDLTIVNKAERASFLNFYARGHYNTDKNAKTTYRPYIFTDRSIYRPGQVVYFKAIATQTTNHETTVYAHQPVKITLTNVNGEEVKELHLKTNAYGSVSGEFILPNVGLTGNYNLQIDAGSYGYATLAVEDYKRPKFETSFDPVVETYKVNDSIILTGKAMGYAGSPITDAQVVYRVFRKTQYPRWFYGFRPWFRSEPQEIAHGEGLTDANGNFEIVFKALPDLTVDQSNLPMFTYEITADVTDINGETRSVTGLVHVGYHALLTQITLDAELNKLDKNHQLTISTNNLNGQPVAAQGIVKIYKLNGPDRVLRPRPWPAPDYKTLSHEEFKSLFPHEAYQDEHNPETWERGSLVFEGDFDTSKSKTMDLGDLKQWTSGKYLVILEATDRFGQLVKDQVQTLVFGPNDKTLPDQQLFHVSTDQATYQPGQNVNITFGSAAKNMVITIDVEKNNKISQSYTISLNNNKKTIRIPVTHADTGGFTVHYSFAAFNSFKSGSLPISVPYPKSELSIETMTFRDKLDPGTEETWRFKIKGPKGDQVSAELLASMYDQSLDQFKPHQWLFNPLYKPNYYSYNRRNTVHSFGTGAFNTFLPIDHFTYPGQGYDQWNWFGLHFYSGSYNQAALRIRGMASNSQDSMMLFKESESDAEYPVTEQAANMPPPPPPSPSGANQEIIETEFETVAVRKNLQETAFFFPQLQTDADGSVSFSFTTPEALTSWKLQLLAHTKALESATATLEAVTQKELMVLPNVPRFLRHGDTIAISTKIANRTENPLSGEAILQLFDGITGHSIDNELHIADNKKPFTVDANGNTQVTWHLDIPDHIDAVQYKIIAKSGDFSDGEQNLLPVLSNRMLVTETLPMWVRSDETRTFTLDKLKNNRSKTLKNHKLTLEMTSNPAWYAIQALPYLMEYPYDCNEQIFSRYYANSLAGHIANSNPKVKAVFDQWASSDVLLSNLEKNEDLKSILIQETPWLRDAQSETEQKKRIALLFDVNKMHYELQATQAKLFNNQMHNGAWAWFEGGRPNRFITQQIISGFGHLKHLEITLNDGQRTQQMIKKAMAYLDAEFIEDYKKIRKYDKDVDLDKNHLNYIQLHYLYMRSFFPEIEKSKDLQAIIAYYQTQIQNYWLSQSLYAKGLMALISHRAKDSKTAVSILKSLKENSITSDELGMYWKANRASWYWYQAPIETQALLIEAFSEIQNDLYTVDNLKIWLLKNKQTNSWKTTKATTEAIYALLLQGSDWLSITDQVTVKLGDDEIAPSKLADVKIEAGTGYYKTAWNGTKIRPEMASVTLAKKGEGLAWGSLYWQYFEDLDVITSAATDTETPLKLSKKLFLKSNTDHGERISEITPETKLKVGDLIRVRIELRCDRNMEFLHIKDQRAAGFEPVNVLSRYKYQDGLGYYESTGDAATHFFIDYLPKGVYIFEYDLRVNNSGTMGNGITSIQSMYAPEFSSHSEGLRIHID